MSNSSTIAMNAGATLGSTAAIASQTAAAAAKTAVNANDEKLKLEKAGQDNALQLI